MSDTDRDRAAFEAAISGPPYERDIERWPDDAKKLYSWPGMYQDYSVALAWEMWQEATKQERAGRPTVPPTSEGMPEPEGEREVLETYRKLHDGKLGAHWLWVVIEQIAAGIPEPDAMREFGYYECAAQARAQALKDAAQECDALASIEGIAQRCAAAIREMKERG